MVDEYVLKMIDLGQVCLMRLLVVLWEMFQVHTESLLLLSKQGTLERTVQ